MLSVLPDIVRLSPGRTGSTQPEEFRRQGQAYKAAEVQYLAAIRNVREQHFDIGMLAIDLGAALVFCVHDPLDRRKIAPAQRVVLIAEQALPPPRRSMDSPPKVCSLASMQPEDSVHGA